MMALSRAVFYVEGTAEGFGVDKAHVAHGRTSVWTGGRASAASAHGCSARIAGRSAFVTGCTLRACQLAARKRICVW
jgi:hypothetical protein